MIGKKRKTLIGRVIGTKMHKTIVVQVQRQTRHPIYKRIVRRYSKFKVHDENSRAQLGDRVKIISTRPLSKEKRWRLVEILQP